MLVGVRCFVAGVGKLLLEVVERLVWRRWGAVGVSGLAKLVDFNLDDFSGAVLDVNLGVPIAHFDLVLADDLVVRLVAATDDEPV